MSKLNVKKANHLVQLEEKMSKAAQLWVSYLVASLPKARAGVDDFPTLQFSFREIKKAINADGKKRIGKVDDVFKVIKELMYTPLWYENKNQRGYVAWLTEVFEDKTTEGQIFNFVFHPKLKPYLLNLENQYTIYNYFYRVCLSTNSMKIYEILKRYQYLGQVDLNIEDDIKAPLGLKGKYEKFYDLKKKVLNVAQKELKEFTDISFEYEISKKEWNKAISLFFVINTNEPTNLPKPLLELVKTNKVHLPLPLESEKSAVQTFKPQFPALYAQLFKLGGKEQVITALIKQYGIEAVKYQAEHVKRKVKQKAKIKDAFGWFRKAVQDNYEDPVQAAKAKKVTAMMNRKKAVSKTKDIAEIIRKLERQRFDAKKQLANALIAKNPELLDKVIGELTPNFRVIRQKITEGKTIKEIYADPMVKGNVISGIAAHFADEFLETDKKYATQIELLKRQK